MIYLDHAATTPLDPSVLEEMLPFFGELYGNPSTLYSLGQAARSAVDTARDRVADLLNVPSREITFTSGGTEADNLALRGVLCEVRPDRRRLIVSSVEHEAVLDTAHFLERHGIPVTVLPVDGDGTVQPDVLRKMIGTDTALVSVMTANNEVGTIQPVAELANVAHEAGALFHTDAVQAVGSVPVHPAELGCDLLSLSGHKIYGPKGSGALWVRSGVHLFAQMTGGGQERRVRSGTENVPAIVGLGKACELANARISENYAGKLSALRDRLIEGVMSAIPDTMLTGHRDLRLPGHASFCFRGVEGEPVLINLDFSGIAASSGSACSSGASTPSHVLSAMGIPADTIKGNLRLTLGKDSTGNDVDRVLDVLPRIVASLRSLQRG
jgi:cysteine desulfurase